MNSAFAAGILSTVAAGNSNEDASTWSPASAADALTVGAVASDWTRWYASNFGAVLDIFAPGADVTSAGIASDTALVSDSGTSMAAPHVAGVALYLQALEGGSAADIVKRILDLAGEGVVEDPSGSPNLMVSLPPFLFIPLNPSFRFSVSLGWSCWRHSLPACDSLPISKSILLDSIERFTNFGFLNSFIMATLPKRTGSFCTTHYPRSILDIS